MASAVTKLDIEANGGRSTVPMYCSAPEDADAGHGEGKLAEYSRSGAGPVGSTKAGRHPTPALTSAPKM